jgi:hypothetical protein
MQDYKYHFRQDIHPDLLRYNDIGISKKFHRIRPEANVWAIGAVMCKCFSEVVRASAESFQVETKSRQN